MTSAAPPRTVSIPAGVSVHCVRLFADTRERYEQIVAEHDAAITIVQRDDGETHEWAKWTVDGAPFVLHPPTRRSK